MIYLGYDLLLELVPTVPKLICVFGTRARSYVTNKLG